MGERERGEQEGRRDTKLKGKNRNEEDWTEDWEGGVDRRVEGRSEWS